MKIVDDEAKNQFKKNEEWCLENIHTSSSSRTPLILSLSLSLSLSPSLSRHPSL